MEKQKYDMSFTAGGLLYSESVKIAELYYDLGDWATVRQQAIATNLLQARTQSSAKRVYREISSRLALLTEEQLRILCNGSRQEQNLILWVAACKKYRFIHDFAIEVLREKFLRMDMELATQDYDSFFYTKAEWHGELDNLSTTTVKKLRQVVFRMLREAELISRNNVIVPVILTHRIVLALLNDESSSFAVLPVTDAAIKEWVR